MTGAKNHHLVLDHTEVETAQRIVTGVPKNHCLVLYLSGECTTHCDGVLKYQYVVYHTKMENAQRIATVCQESLSCFVPC